MKTVAISQRVVVEPSHGERRDCLDQAWTRFLVSCDLCPAPVPNDEAAALALCARTGIDGIILTGGNDLVSYGGDAPERDRTEFALIEFAEKNLIPVLGVCRGMQTILHRFGVKLEAVNSHITPRQRIRAYGDPIEVNSYHRFAAFETCPALKPWAFAEDGAVEAVRSVDDKLVGVMWHPERTTPFAARDIALFRNVFGVE
jgi:gamma-glutamyl-gamma-aminobutyrate hydrolase PuuD